MNSKQIKLAAATLGTGAVLTMGALAVVSPSFAQDPPEPAPPGPVTTSEVTTGESITDGPAPEAPETSVATPPITTTAAPIEPTASP